MSQRIEIGGALVPDAVKAEIADRPMPPDAPERGLVGAAAGRDVAWFALSQADDQGSYPTCTVQSCLDLVEMAWRLKGVAVPNLRGIAAYTWARNKYYGGEHSGGGLQQEQAFVGALETGLFPPNTKCFQVSGEDDERDAMLHLPLIDVEAVTEGWQPQFVNPSNGYFDPTLHPAITGYHSDVRLAMLFEGCECWHAKHVHWGSRFGVKGVLVYHRSRYLKYKAGSAWRVKFPDGYEAYEGWRMHVN